MITTILFAARKPVAIDKNVSTTKTTIHPNRKTSVLIFEEDAFKSFVWVNNFFKLLKKYNFNKKPYE
jgi:hypothetical protein